MDSPILSAVSPASQRSGSPDVNIGRKFTTKPVRDSCPEISKWMRMKGGAVDDDTNSSAEAQKEFKTEILNGLRELQKENDETAWMYKRTTK